MLLMAIFPYIGATVVLSVLREYRHYKFLERVVRVYGSILAIVLALTMFQGG